MPSLKDFVAQVRGDFSGAAERAGIDPLLTAARVLLYVLLIGVVVGQIVGAIGIVVHIVTQNVALLVPPYAAVWRPLGSLFFGVVTLSLIGQVIHHLLAMIRAVERGEAFASDNVGRIESIAGHVLGMQVLGTFAQIIRVPVGGEFAGADFGLDLSPMGIAIVLLLFILARVFRKGAEMRDELEGTV